MKNKLKFKPKLIIDTDPGHDDALALMLMIKANLFEIKAITTVAGNTDIKQTTRNAQFILDLLDSKVPIYSGSSKPLKRKLVKAVVHGESGLDGVDTSKTKYQLTDNAVEKIIELLETEDGKTTLLALGPLTNIAKVLTKRSDLKNRIKEIVIMGGAINVPGNKNRVAEFNFFVDPEAVEAVFKSGLKIILIPLDACNDIVLSLDDFEKLKNSNLYLPVKAMMKKFIQGLTMDESIKGALVYDAIAAYYLVNPGAFKLETMDIVIETKGKYTFGMSVAEKRVDKALNKNALVAKEVNKKLFTKEFIEFLRMK